MSHRKLFCNIRANKDPWFAEYLLHIDGGFEVAKDDGEIHLPHKICVSHTTEDSDMDTLIDCIFYRLNENMSNKTYIASSVVISM